MLIRSSIETALGQIGLTLVAIALLDFAVAVETVFREHSRTVL